MANERKQPYTDDHVHASVAGGLVDEARGHYKELVYTGCQTAERALEIKRSLYRCSKRLGYSMHAKIEKAADGTFNVRFKAIDKAKARAYIVATYGPDRSKWPYNPRRGRRR